MYCIICHCTDHVFCFCFRNADDNKSHFSTKAWLEKVIVIGAQKPNGISIKDNGKYFKSQSFKSVFRFSPGQLNLFQRKNSSRTELQHKNIELRRTCYKNKDEN